MRYSFHKYRAILATALVVFSLTADRIAAQSAVGTKGTSITGSPDKSTPLTSDGHPDLNGNWTTETPFSSLKIAKNGSSVCVEGCGSERAKSLGFNQSAARPAGQNVPDSTPPAPQNPKPPYKPELLEKVSHLNDYSNQMDPNFRCKPPGIPRIGPPQKIVQTPREIVFLYNDETGNYFRVIPLDGHSPHENAEPAYLGYSVGHWDGDTLVVDATDFNDDTWLKNGGLFHSTALHVTERLRREGNTIDYQVTVEDPNVLTKPWTWAPRHLAYTDEEIEEASLCRELDTPHLTNLDHH